MQMDGYVYVYVPENPRAREDGWIKRCRIIAERVFGRYLPNEAVIHHVDGNTFNDAKSNLVICEDNSYHIFIEARTRAYQACGNAHWRKCVFCKEYDDLSNLYEHQNGSNSFGYRHKSCYDEYSRKIYQRKKKGGLLWELNRR